MPYARNHFFTGREDVLRQLHDALVLRRRVGFTEPQALIGLGGIGKTQTAVEFAYRYQSDFNPVFWVRAETETTLQEGLLDIARMLRLMEAELADQNLAIEAAKVWLANDTRYLLILDNVDKPLLPRKFLPVNPAGQVLITSRVHVLDQLNVGKPIELLELPAEEALTFLFDRAKCKQSDDQERSAAQKLAKELGYLPLALEQAASYIAANDYSFQDYLQDYYTLHNELLDAQGHVHLDLIDERGANAGAYAETVRTTWNKSFEAVKAQSQAAADILYISAFLNPERIPYELFTSGAAELGESLATALAGAKQDPRLWNKLLALLTGYSLIRRDNKTRTFNVHHLVQSVTHVAMDEATERVWVERTLRALAHVFPEPQYESWPICDWSSCDRFLPHAQACIHFIKDHEPWHAGRLYYKAGMFLWERERYALAEEFLKNALETRTNTLHPQDPDLARTIHGLADHYRHIGQFLNAESLYKREKNIWEAQQNVESLDLTRCLHGLALLYRDWGRYREARPLYQHALKIRQKILGAEHLHVIWLQHDLAEILCYLRRYKEAERIFLKVLDSVEINHGTEHSFIAWVLHNLASYCKKDRLAEAVELFHRSLDIRKKVYGPDSHHVAGSLHGLAELYRHHGWEAEAEPLYLNANKIWNQTLGADHHEAALGLDSLALLYGRQGRYFEAKTLHERALAIRERVFGPDHPYIADSLNNLARLYFAKGWYEEAEPLLRRALAIREKALGPAHRDVVNVRDNYAFLRRKLAKS